MARSQATDVAIGSVAANDTEFLLIEGDYTVPDNLTGLSLIARICLASKRLTPMPAS